jgi:YesN/AraC family two-component response regulator
MLQLTAPPLPFILDAGEDTYKKGQSHPNRKQIGVFDLLIVTRGCLYMGEGEEKYAVESEHALILYPDNHHFSYIPCNQETHFYWFHFSVIKEWKDITEATIKPLQLVSEKVQTRNPFTEKPFGIILPKFTKLHNWNEFHHICKQIAQVDNVSNYNREWERQKLFQQFLQRLALQTNVSKSLPSLAVAEQAAAYLRKNFREKISYQSLGEALRFHPNHIARCMIHSLGFSPIEYLNKIRLDQAKILLITKNWSIEQIAEQCGYSQTAYFSRLFKKHEGITPRDFRMKYVGNKH